MTYGRKIGSTQNLLLKADPNLTADQDNLVGEGGDTRQVEEGCSKKRNISN
jgi:hypothetical protein